MTTLAFQWPNKPGNLLDDLRELQRRMNDPANDFPPQVLARVSPTSFAQLHALARGELKPWNLSGGATTALRFAIMERLSIGQDPNVADDDIVFSRGSFKPDEPRFVIP